MHHIKFNEVDTFDLAILIKFSAFKKKELEANYINNIKSITPNINVIGFDLDYGGAKKPSATTIKSYLKNLLQILDDLGVTNILVADGEYFKKLVGTTKAEPHYGYVLPCKIDGYEHMSVTLTLNYQTLFYNPDNQSKIDLSLKALTDHIQGSYKAIGSDIIHSEYYPDNLQTISDALDNLHQYPVLTCDVETFSLHHMDAGIGTIAFAWDKHNGIAFCCDYTEDLTDNEYYGRKLPREASRAFGVRKLLIDFFTKYQGKILYHNATFDTKVIIYNLWMQNQIDHVGLINGLEVMTRNFDDTKIITYLATNSCAGNKLSLKDQAHEFAGNYAESEINDIRLIPNKQLLRYNLVDCLATWYVYEKHLPTMIKDDQSQIHQEIMLPSLKTIIQMELTGMPMDMDKTLYAERRLTRRRNAYLKVMENNPVLESFIEASRHNTWVKDYETRRDKAKNPDKIKWKDYEDITFEFNPNSNPQLQTLLYEFMDLPVIDLTDTKQPATGAKTLEKLINHAKKEYVPFLRALILYSKTSKILSSFIPSFKDARLAEDGIYYLYGSFILGGTKSGRLSSKNPNLQNIPSGSHFAKLVKKCFKGNKDYIFCGADFNSLEDYVSALTTKDPNKLKVYIDGYDGHCLRAYYYRDEGELTDIVETPESINSIKKLYPDIRQESKAPTFALTYQGMWKTLVNNLGWTEAKAKRVEAAFHTLYAQSKIWVSNKLEKATHDGWIETAFGLKLRTPILAKTLLGTKVTPYEAEAEGRTAGNALGQGYGMLNNRAANEFMNRVRNSKYKYDIRLCAMIHDAIYLLIANKLGVVEWVNNNLIDCMRWQELPELQHDTVKLGAELGIFAPDWSNEITLDNDISLEDIKAALHAI